MGEDTPATSSSPGEGLRDAFCQTCSRATYLAAGVEPFCPVCSSPLVEPSSSSEPEAV